MKVGGGREGAAGDEHKRRLAGIREGCLESLGGENVVVERHGVGVVQTRAEGRLVIGRRCRGHGAMWRWRKGEGGA